MAKFDKAYQRTVAAEGGYANDPLDRGGETYMGISRKAHPNSTIWQTIDAVDKKGKTNKQITNILIKNTHLTHQIKLIYKKEYWDMFKLDNCKSQRLANEIFDDAVNRGCGNAAYLLNRTFGLGNSKKITKELLAKIAE